MNLHRAEAAHVPVAPNGCNGPLAPEKSLRLWNPRHFRDEAAPFGVQLAAHDDLAAAHQLAEELVGMRLAPLSALADSHALTEASAWTYKCPDTREVAGVLLNLPLNAEGEIALILGRFNTGNPDPEHLCAPGDPVSAMYIWFTGGRGLRARSAVMRTALAWRDGVYGSLRAYSRAATSGGARGLAALRFAPLASRDLGLMFCDKRR
jgi:hypothetical protein